jgi:UrcA family protein
MFKPLIASTALAVGLSLAGVSNAQTLPVSDAQPRQMVVKYDDLNIATPAGAKALKHRIEDAARAVCGPEPDIRELASSQDFKTCMTRAQSSAAAPIAEAMAHTLLEEAR